MPVLYVPVTPPVIAAAFPSSKRAIVGSNYMLEFEQLWYLATSSKTRMDPGSLGRLRYGLDKVIVGRRVSVRRGVSLVAVVVG